MSGTHSSKINILNPRQSRKHAPCVLISFGSKGKFILQLPNEDCITTNATVVVFTN